jgi:hypothetical protein
MSKILKFQEDENCECPFCDLINEFLQYSIEADTKDELKDILTGLANEARIVGFRDALEQDVRQKIAFLEGESCDCDICDEENCGLDQ